MKQYLILVWALALALSHIDAATIDIIEKIDTFTTTEPIKKGLREANKGVSYSATGTLKNIQPDKIYTLGAFYDGKQYIFSVSGSPTEAVAYMGYGTIEAETVFNQLQKAYEKQS